MKHGQGRRNEKVLEFLGTVAVASGDSLEEGLLHLGEGEAEHFVPGVSALGEVSVFCAKCVQKGIFEAQPRLGVKTEICTTVKIRILPPSHITPKMATKIRITPGLYANLYSNS